MKWYYNIWLLLFVLLHPAAVSIYAQGLKINEVQYVNQQTLFDSEGDSPDWIEIINTGNNIINLHGYQLSDDQDINGGWSFPKLELQPDSVIIVFASGNDKHSIEELHADFKLKLMEDAVYLLSPEGVTIDSIEATCIPPDKSIGRQPDGSPILKILSPTPGDSNNKAQVEIINFQNDSLVISHQGGFYKDRLLISLSRRYEGNQILFTLDGTDPELESTPYSKPIILQDISGEKNRFASLADSKYSPGDFIAKANILRAQVFSEGCPASTVISSTFFINESGDPGYQVPIVSLITDGDNLFDDEVGIYTEGNYVNYSKHGKEWERPVHVEVFDSAGTGILNQDAGMRIHGAGSRAGDQKSLRLYAREEYGTAEFAYPLFDQKPEITSFKTLLLRGVKEWSGTLFKDELCHSLVSGLQLDYLATQTSVLFINGEYWGIHSCRERQDEFYAENNYGYENPELDIISFKSTGFIVEDGSLDSYEALIDSFQINNPADEHFYSRLSSWIDLENMIDYYCAQFYLANTDWPLNNYKMWKVRSADSKWRFFFYDLDGTMRQISSISLSDHFNTIDGFQFHPDHTTYVFSRALQNPEFRNRFFSRLSDLLQNSFNPAIVTERINEYQKRYQALVSEHIYRWHHPEDFRSWISNVNMLRSFASQRPQVMFDQLASDLMPKWKVYPNPSIDLLYIDSPPEFDRMTIKIYTLNGRCMIEKYFGGSAPLTLYHNLDPGAYIIEMKSGFMLQHEKLFVGQ
jgi:CotH protein/lamin tail-like protein/chitobiase/beta-hexosaminidase-like protein